MNNMSPNLDIEISKSTNVVYYIDRDNGEVIARIKCDEDDPQHVFDSQLIKHACGIGLGPVQEMDISIFKYRIKSEYVGKAKCHPDDEFDVEFGKRLALLRAKQKYLKAMESKMYEINEWIQELAERTNNLYLRQYRQRIDNGSDLYTCEYESWRDAD